MINDLAMHDARSSKADDAGGASSDLFLKPGDNRNPRGSEPGSSRMPYRPAFSCEPCGLLDEVDDDDGATPAPAGLFTRSRVGSSTKVA